LKALLIIYFYFYDFQDNYIENFNAFSDYFSYLSYFSEKINPSLKTWIYRSLFEIH